MSIGIGYNDEVFLKKAFAIYPKMCTSRLIHMIIREWLEYRSGKTPDTVNQALEILKEFVSKSEARIKTVRKLNDFI